MQSLADVPVGPVADVLVETVLPRAASIAVNTALKVVSIALAVAVLLVP